jgi:tetratricopeptide (TPR) repeat protein
MASRKTPVLKEWTPPHILSFGVLIALVAVAYANSLHGKFIFDDPKLIQQDDALMNVKTFGDVISLIATGGWRKLLRVTYALNYYWGGLDSFGYHVVNVSLHAINVLLVYGIILAALREEARSRYVALGGAAVFAVHTLMSSAVSYVAGRSSVLCATFYFAAIYLFLRGLNAERPGIRGLFFGFTAIAGLLAWGAKQEAITLPVFLAAVLFLRMEKKDWRWIAALAVMPLILLAVMWDNVKALYATTTGNKDLLSAGFGNVLPPATYFRTYLSAVVGYFFPRFVYPNSVSIDPQFTPVEYWYSSEFLIAAGFLALLGWLGMRFYRREPLFGLAVVAMLASPLIAYAAIPLADVVLEHRAYIPGLGIAFLFAWIFYWIGRNYSSVRWAAIALVVAMLGFMTVSRNPVFATNITVWEDAVAKAPEKPRTHFNLGQAYQDAQRLPDAIREYEQALKLKPDIYAAYSNMAAIYLDRMELDKAEEMLLKVTSLAPNFTGGFINLGVLYTRKQEPDKALVALNRALEIDPGSFMAHFNKGEALTQKGDYKAALDSYKAAVHIRPDLDGFRLTLGNAYIRVGDPVSAEKQFNELTKSSVAPEAYRNLGLLYSNAGQPDQAMQYFRQAVRLKPVFPDLHDDIGIVYLRKGMFDEAIEEFRTVLQQQPGHGPAFLNLAAAYQSKGDLQSARQTLQAFVDQNPDSNSPYVLQARQRLVSLP